MKCYNCKQDIGSATTCPYCGAVVLKEPRPHHLPSGSMIAGRYRIDGVLGEGGFGITYLGRDSKLGHAIAIKEYFPQGLTHRYTDGSYEVYASSSDEDQTFIHGRERFLKEAQTLAQFTAELRVWKHIGPASPPPQRAAERRSTGGGVAVRIAVCDDQNVLMCQQTLCAAFIVHLRYPRPVLCPGN